MTLAIQGMSLKKENMLQAVMTSFMPAVEMAEYLAVKGVPFREAHHIVGAMVKACEEKGIFLWEMSVENMVKFCPAFDNSVFDYIEPHNVVNARKVSGAASIGEVRKSIESEKTYLSS